MTVKEYSLSHEYKKIHSKQVKQGKRNTKNRGYNPKGNPGAHIQMEKEKCNRRRIFPIRPVFQKWLTLICIQILKLTHQL